MNTDITTIADGDEDLIEITKSELAQKEKPKNNGNLNFNLINRPPQPLTANPEESQFIDPSLYPSERTAKRR
jgi:hypothetical protein